MPHRNFTIEQDVGETLAVEGGDTVFDDHDGLFGFRQVCGIGVIERIALPLQGGAEYLARVPWYAQARAGSKTACQLSIGSATFVVS